MFSVEYTVVYVEILLLCLIFTVIIRSKVSRDLGSNYEVRAFNWILNIFIAMMAIESVEQIHYAGLIHPPLWVMYLCYSGYMFLIGLLGVAWLVFAEYQIDIDIMQRPHFRAVCILLVAVLAILSIGTFWTGWLYYFDEQGVYQRGPLFFMQNVLAYAVIMATSVHLFWTAAKERSSFRRKKMLMLATFIVSPFIGSLLQLLIGGYPFVGPSIGISIMFIFVSIQNNMINTDALTGLNNRKCMERYLEEIRQDVTEVTPYYFFIIDADHFKDVNDTKGHLEGDRALRHIADALRLAGDEYHGFIARFGGDEFVAIASARHLGAPQVFADAVNAHLKEVCEAAKIDYPLSVSIGFSRFSSADISQHDLISRADGMLYEQKQRH